jgi:hypothetical protein
MNEEERVDELLGALRMQTVSGGFAARTLRAIALAEQARRLRQLMWSLLGASAASIVTMVIVLMSGALRVSELSASVALFASRAMPWVRMATHAVQLAPSLFTALLVLALLCCTLATILLERAVCATGSR